MHLLAELCRGTCLAGTEGWPGALARPNTYIDEARPKNGLGKQIQEPNRWANNEKATEWLTSETQSIGARSRGLARASCCAHEWVGHVDMSMDSCSCALDLQAHRDVCYIDKPTGIVLLEIEK